MDKSSKAITGAASPPPASSKPNSGKISPAKTTKKKKGAASSSKSKASPTAAAAAKKRKRGAAATTSKKASVSAQTPPPSHTLLIDNGGDTLKYGLIRHMNDDNSTNPATTASPRSMPNLTAKLKHQWTNLVGDLVHTVQPTQLEAPLSRSVPERGCVSTAMGTQVMVWKRVLDLLEIQTCPASNEAAQTFGWKDRSAAAATNSRGVGGTSKKKNTTNKSDASTTQQSAQHSASTMAVVLMVSPLCPRTLLDQMFQVWFHDFGFAHVGFLTTSVMGGGNHQEDRTVRSSTTTPSRNSTGCCCVVDMGYSATQVVPLYHETPILPTKQTTTPVPATFITPVVKRLPLGSKHLIRLWQYYTSYRQWNLMDADLLMQDLFVQLAYVALDFDSEMKVAQSTHLGQRPYDREYVLPDYQTTHEGIVRLAPFARAQAAAAARKEPKEEVVKQEPEGPEEVETEHVNKEQPSEDAPDLPEGRDDDDSGNDDDDNNDVDSEDETDDQRRARLLKQQAQEERRRQELEAERQVLMVSVERFAVPEVLLRPTDVSLDLAGLHQVICAAIQACPRIYQSALYGNIRLIGGLSKVPNLKERLLKEVRMIVPTNYYVHIDSVDDPINHAWTEAREWLQTTPFTKWSISRAEFETSLKSKDVQKRTLLLKKLLDNGKLV